MTFKTVPTYYDEAIKDICAWKTPIMYWRNPSLDNVVPPDDPLDEFAIANESKNLFLTFVQHMMYLYRFDHTEPEARNLVECDEPAHFTTLFELYEDFADSRFLCQIIELFNDCDLELHNFASFMELLHKVFKVPVQPHERIISVYYFCSRAVISCLELELYGSFQIVLSWALRFIQSILPSYIKAAGGWEKVLTHRPKEPILFIVKTIVSLSMGFYLWKPILNSVFSRKDI